MDKAPSTMRWHSADFEALGVHALYEVLALRCRVFILEQGPYQDPDGLDQHSLHLLGRHGQTQQLHAYLRIVAPGHKYAEPSIGRVITAPEVRGQGLGRVLMQQGLQLACEHWPGQGVRISAQARLARLYGSLGFVAVGDPYLEDGIPHQQMFRAAA
jgi:ElaA protein